MVRPLTKPLRAAVPSIFLWLLPTVLSAKPIADTPFWQDVAVRIHHAPELTNAIFKKNDPKTNLYPLLMIFACSTCDPNSGWTAIIPLVLLLPSIVSMITFVSRIAERGRPGSQHR